MLHFLIPKNYSPYKISNLIDKLQEYINRGLANFASKLNRT